MFKKLFSLFILIALTLINTNAAVFAQAIKGHIEHTDSKQSDTIKKLYTGKYDVLDEKDVMKMTVSQVLSGSFSEEGDEFFAEITEDVAGNGGIIVPKGSIMHGVIVNIQDAKNAGRNGYIVTAFDYIVMPDGRQVPIKASLSTKENLAKGTAKNVVRHIGYTAVGGALGGLYALNLVGIESAIASHGGTIALGAAIGGAVGLAGAIINKGKKVYIKPGDELKVTMISNIELPVFSKEAFKQEEILYDGLDTAINKVYYEKDPFGENNTLTLDLMISNMTKKTFYAFDIALINDLRHTFYPSPFGDTSLWFKKIEPGDKIQGKLSFAVNDKNNRHWLVFYDRATREPLAKYSIDNLLYEASVKDRSKKRKKS